MNTIYSCLVERRNFGDLLSVEGVAQLQLTTARGPQSLLEELSPRDQSLLAVWSREPRKGALLPDLLVCQDGTESDWAAWITTFGAQIRPFSAFTRLMGRSAFEDLPDEAPVPTLGHVGWPVAGLVLGEVLAASGLPDKALETMPANACESTLSFVIFRAAAMHQPFREWRQLLEGWEFVRQVTKQHARTIDSRAVARVCATVIEAANLNDSRELFGPNDADLVRACREVTTSPESPPSSLSLIPQFASIEKRMYGPREDRVVAFSELVRSVERSPAAEGELVSFMLGYLASRIAPGTIQHSTVLQQVTRRYATALLWYGFCAGLGGTEARSRSASGGSRSTVDLPPSARRVARDLVRPEPIVATPTCDISFLELFALSRTGGDPLAALIRTTQGTATIELVPGVQTIVNVSSKVGVDESVRTTKQKEILATMGEHIDQLRWAYEDLVRSSGEETGQRSLFPPRRKKS